MEAFDKKVLKTARGYTYTYYTRNGNESLPTLFFHHGWPDNAEMWKDVATLLSGTRYPMIIPDLLGYDGTDKPEDPEEYRWDKMLPDLIEIADKEGATRLIAIGHDFGSVCASHLYSYFPERVVGLININVPYAPPGRQPFDLDAFNAMAEKAYGMQVFAYWHLFTAEDGPDILKQNAGRLYTAIHGKGESLKDFFCVKDALRNYLLADGEENPVRPYAEDPSLRQAFVDRFNRDGFQGPQCWYKARFLNHQYRADKNLPESRDKVNVPTLFVGGKEDAVCRPEGLIPHIKAGLLPKLEQMPLLDAGHWPTLETPKELVAYIEPWLEKHFSS
ncbi:hypothetical protein NLU13_3761 [Sarocladium strictum]|uniref:AB hydrolase-1 domain-containing protein n=1 Tax=Sarocladium strictum TaxID=5046 RepID=A0AA39L866_SARSR|nr:hypothetical protein NLU13_3761 [Sarocladium strictum]